MSSQLPSKTKLAIVRTVTCWCSYDPKRREISHLRKYKYQVPERTGCYVFQLKGHYIPVRK